MIDGNMLRDVDQRAYNQCMAVRVVNDESHGYAYRLYSTGYCYEQHRCLSTFDTLHAVEQVMDGRTALTLVVRDSGLAVSKLRVTDSGLTYKGRAIPNISLDVVASASALTPADILDLVLVEDALVSSELAWYLARNH